MFDNFNERKQIRSYDELQNEQNQDENETQMGDDGE